MELRNYRIVIIHCRLLGRGKGLKTTGNEPQSGNNDRFSGVPRSFMPHQGHFRSPRNRFGFFGLGARFYGLIRLGFLRCKDFLVQIRITELFVNERKSRRAMKIMGVNLMKIAAGQMPEQKSHRSWFGD